MTSSKEGAVIHACSYCGQKDKAVPAKQHAVGADGVVLAYGCGTHARRLRKDWPAAKIKAVD